MTKRGKVSTSMIFRIFHN